MAKIPWLLALVTALWFGVMALRARRNWLPWALGGALLGLVVTTYIFGLGHAASIPFSDHERLVLHLEWTGISVVIIAALGWLCTLNLHCQHLALWRRIKKTASGRPSGKG